MHIDLTAFTALAVLLHLGTSLARTFLKDNTDRKKIAAIDAKVDQVVTVVSAIAPVVPAAAPKTLAQLTLDLANIAQALAAANTAPAVNTAGGAG